VTREELSSCRTIRPGLVSSRQRAGHDPGARLLTLTYEISRRPRLRWGVSRMGSSMGAWAPHVPLHPLLPSPLSVILDSSKSTAAEYLAPPPFGFSPPSLRIFRGTHLYPVQQNYLPFINCSLEIKDCRWCPPPNLIPSPLFDFVHHDGREPYFSYASRNPFCVCFRTSIGSALNFENRRAERQEAVQVLVVCIPAPRKP
jgi:hypothetical protein